MGKVEVINTVIALRKKNGFDPLTSDICEHMVETFNYKRASVYQMISQSVDRGYLERYGGRSSKRTFHHTVTGKGLNYIEKEGGHKLVLQKGDWKIGTKWFELYMCPSDGYMEYRLAEGHL